jgi:hypothetical protein
MTGIGKYTNKSISYSSFWRTPLPPEPDTGTKIDCQPAPAPMLALLSESTSADRVILTRVADTERNYSATP